MSLVDIQLNFLIFAESSSNLLDDSLSLRFVVVVVVVVIAQDENDKLSKCIQAFVFKSFS